MLTNLTHAALLRAHNFIGGQWLPAANGHQLDVLNPATGAVCAQVPDSGAVDARAAVDAAQAAFGDWRARSGRERAQLLKRWHALILTHQDDLARLISTEQGKPLAESRGEVLYGASYVEWFAEEATRTYGDMLQMGVIDPAKVTRLALQNAASIASLILTTDCMIATAPKPSSESGAHLPEGGMAPMY